VRSGAIAHTAGSSRPSGHWRTVKFRVVPPGEH
jgi:hypothetical protein